MQLTGGHFIGSKRSSNGSGIFYAVNPENGKELSTAFHEGTTAEINDAIQLSTRAFLKYSKTSNEERANFLEAIADEILALGDELISRAMSETALPQGRLSGERGRTMGQLRLFAEVVREGSWVDARIDTAMPDRSPFPRPDIRHLLVPLGPVGIFGASNFPLAFSVAGGDTVSALASGCTVVVKGHPAHPGTSELVASAIITAAEKTGMPNGVFSMIQGRTNEVGQTIVNHEQIKAIGFTGSFNGGKALFDLANKREEPIPVYAEMGSTNPVFILPGALSERTQEIAEGLANSVTLGVGQFCTNPGLVILSESPACATFKKEISSVIRTLTAGTMLTSGIKSAFEKGVEKLTETPGVQILASGLTGTSDNSVSGKIFNSSIDNFQEHPELEEEVFGPSTILIESSSKEALVTAARSLKGHLTATVFGNEEDLVEYASLFDILSQKVGRILINGFPTGVEVCHAMVHGGPFPATTDVRSTSVGTSAIKRFARPLCYQNFPPSLLPQNLRDENPLNIWRLINGNFSKETIN